MSASQLNVGIVSNYVGKCWLAFNGFVFLPLFLRKMGPDAYGLISFSAVLGATLSIADMGLRAALTRELAFRSGGDFGAYRAKLASSIELIVCCITAIAVMVLLSLSGFLSSRWLHYEELSSSDVRIALCLMIFSLGCQIQTTLYYGGMNGLQQQMLSNSLIIGSGVVKQCGAVCVLFALSSSVVAFFCWAAFADGLALLISRAALWRALGGRPTGKWVDWPSARAVAGYSTGMLLVSINALALGQLDKILVSAFSTLHDLAVYSVALMLASAPAALVSPVAAAALPRISELFGARAFTRLNNDYRHCAVIVAVVGIPFAAGVAFFSEDFLRIWVRQQSVAAAATVPCSILSVGFILIVLQTMPYTVLLATADVMEVVKIGVIGLVVYVPLAALLVTRYDLLGAAISWCVLQLVVTGAYLRALRKVDDVLLWRTSFKTGAIALAGSLVILIPAYVIRRELFDRGSSSGAAVGLFAILLSAGFAYGLLRLRFFVPKCAAV